MKFRKLNKDKVIEFKKWARENYIPFDIIKGIWHPVIQFECVQINIENSEFITQKEEENEDMTKEIATKIENGDPLTDEELNIAIGFYKQLEESLHIIGEKFMIFSIITTLKSLEGFKYWRNKMAQKENKK